MIPGFNQLKTMYKSGKLGKDVRKEYLKEIQRQERLDKLKNFKASDGTIIDLDALKRDIRPKNDLLIVPLPTFPSKDHKIPIDILFIE